MSPQVQSQVPSLSELLVTFRALEWFRTRVRAMMPLQAVGSDESFSANITSGTIFEIMAPQMKLSGGFHWGVIAKALTKMNFPGRRRCLRVCSHRLPPGFSAAESAETVAHREERRLESIQYF